MSDAAPDWSRKHPENTPAEVQSTLLREFAAATGIKQPPAYAVMHRWRLRGPMRRWASRRYGTRMPDWERAATGAWARGGEYAFTSGRALTARVAP